MRHSSVFPRGRSGVGIQGPTDLSCLVPYQRVPCVAVFAGYLPLTFSGFVSFLFYVYLEHIFTYNILDFL